MGEGKGKLAMILSGKKRKTFLQGFQLNLLFRAMNEQDKQVKCISACMSFTAYIREKRKILHKQIPAQLFNLFMTFIIKMKKRQSKNQPRQCLAMLNHPVDTFAVSTKS